MRYFAVVSQLPRLMDLTETIHYCKLDRVVKTLRAEFGLKPVEQKTGSILFDREDVDAAINRWKLRDQKEAKAAPRVAEEKDALPPGCTDKPECRCESCTKILQAEGSL